MTSATVFVSKPSSFPIPWSSWTTKSPVRRSAKLCSARPAGAARVRRALAEDLRVRAAGRARGRARRSRAAQARRRRRAPARPGAGRPPRGSSARRAAAGSQCAAPRRGAGRRRRRGCRRGRSRPARSRPRRARAPRSPGRWASKACGLPTRERLELRAALERIGSSCRPRPRPRAPRSGSQTRSGGAVERRDEVVRDSGQCLGLVAEASARCRSSRRSAAG